MSLLDFATALQGGDGGGDGGGAGGGGGSGGGGGDGGGGDKSGVVAQKSGRRSSLFGRLRRRGSVAAGAESFDVSCVVLMAFKKASKKSQGDDGETPSVRERSAGAGLVLKPELPPRSVEIGVGNAQERSAAAWAQALSWAVEGAHRLAGGEA